MILLEKRLNSSVPEAMWYLLE